MYDELEPRVTFSAAKAYAKAASAALVGNVNVHSKELPDTAVTPVAEELFYHILASAGDGGFHTHIDRQCRDGCKDGWNDEDWEFAQQLLQWLGYITKVDRDRHDRELLGIMWNRPRGVRTDVAWPVGVDPDRASARAVWRMARDYSVKVALQQIYEMIEIHSRVGQMSCTFSDRAITGSGSLVFIRDEVLQRLRNDGYRIQNPCGLVWHIIWSFGMGQEV